MSAARISPVPAPKLSAVEPKRKPKWQYGTPLLIVLLAAALLFAMTRNWDAWEGGRASQVTDDAYVRGELTPLSTKASGIVGEARTSDYQQVRRGDVLVRLEDGDFKAQVSQTTAVEAAKAVLPLLAAGPPMSACIWPCFDNKGGA
jgi:membrane fusion protein, multidrug efflux system